MFDSSVLDFELPNSLKAVNPDVRPTDTKLLIYNRKDGSMRLEDFQALPEILDDEPVYVNTAKLDDKCNHLYRTECVYAKDFLPNGKGGWAVPSAGLPIPLSMLDDLNLKRLSLFIPEFKTRGLPQQYEMNKSEMEEFIFHDPFPGKPVFAIGTTVVKALESFSNVEGSTIIGNRGWSELLITPGHVFKNVKGIMTNFHYPKEPLMAMVAAFVGVRQCMEIYRYALAEKLRFIDFGDRLLVI